VKRNFALATLSFLILALAPVAHARVVTLTAIATPLLGNPVGVPGTNEVFIESYEVAEVVSFPTAMNVNSSLDVIKDGRTAILQPWSVPNQGFDPLVVAGPVTIRLRVAADNRAGLCTVKITPEAYPPDKSILVAPGAGGAAITLECSTNLVNWMAATNGVYTNLPAAKFFRIKEERIPASP